MGCFGRNGRVNEHAKWDYINLDDFHATSSWTPLSYLWVWIYGAIGVAVFAVDCFTAINLLVLDRWASQIKPKLDLKYSKWIFVGCILFSFALYAFEWLRALRVMRRGGVAESYMDPLAVQVQCMRKKGWKRFLVFASLTKSRKGTDYIAFFVYFQFNNAIRIIFAEGGRQVVNAITIISVAQSDLVPIGAHAAKAGSSPVLQFFLNIQALYQKQSMQALILSSMVFTLAIWIFSAICLITALLLYLVFLWHYVPQSDGRLSIYCRRKIDRRLEKIVEKKVQAALEESERKAYKNAAKTGGKSNKSPTVSTQALQPTLPNLGKFDSEKSSEYGLSRTDTTSTLPVYTPRPPTRNESPQMGIQRQPTLPEVALTANMPPRPQRQGTQNSGFSDHSYASNASLLHNAEDMGYGGRPESPYGAPPPLYLGRQGSNSSLNSRPGPARTMTNSTMSSARSYGGAPRGMPPRSNSAFGGSEDRNPMSRAGSAMDGAHSFGPPGRAPTNDTWTIPEQPSREETPLTGYTDSVYSQISQQRQVSRASFSRPFVAQDRNQGRSTPGAGTPAPPVPSIPSTTSPVAGSSGGYVAFNPYANRSPSVPAAMQPRPLQRNLTNPVELQRMSPEQQYSHAGPVQRSHTAPLNDNRPGQYGGGRF